MSTQQTSNLSANGVTLYPHFIKPVYLSAESHSNRTPSATHRLVCIINCNTICAAKCSNLCQVKYTTRAMMVGVKTSQRYIVLFIGCKWLQNGSGWLLGFCCQEEEQEEEGKPLLAVFVGCLKYTHYNTS